MGRRKSRLNTGLVSGLVVAAFVLGLFVGTVIMYSANSQELKQLQNLISDLQDRVSKLKPENRVYILGDNASLSDLYEATKDSVVLIRGTLALGLGVQGSGFVCEYKGRFVVATNFHVVHDTTSITVTFRNGNTYLATVLGSDPYADFAVLSVDAPTEEFKPLRIVSSSTLKVGDPVVAIGNPFGLTGSMTVGIVSQLGRTIQESTIGRYSIANIIQTSAQINPGNSGGPLLNYAGEVVGITTAIVSDSQGLGFAIPSNMILREIGPLIETGSYDQHSWLGVIGTDMSYEIAKAMNTDYTYGWLITDVVKGGPADKAGIRAGTTTIQTPSGLVTIGGDIVVGIDGTRVVSGDDLLTYLAEYTKPNQTIEMKIVRNNETMVVKVTLGKRPPPP
jgi:S1-C subfamily serine protease